MTINFSATDMVKQSQLKRMKSLALWLLIFMAAVFAVSFALQERIPAFGFVRAASEGGMVGAIADWFAVTALFRHPLGLKIPHTNLIARKKDEIGKSLGDFVEENFLSDTVINEKLAEMNAAKMAGEWLQKPDSAQKVSGVASQALTAFLTVIDDDDVRGLLEQLLEKHVIGPEWSGMVADALEQLLTENQQDTAIDMLAEHLGSWLENNPESFDRLFTSQLPSWIPSFANRFVDKQMYSQALKFVLNVRFDPVHPLRQTVSKMLTDLTRDLKHDPAFIERVEELKKQVFSSSRVRGIVVSAWSSARETLLKQLGDRSSEIHARIASAASDLGQKLATDESLQKKTNKWIVTASGYLVQNYRHDLASIIGDTVERWDPAEATRKIELQVGKDLQFIRINGTIVGALAGVTIYAIATLVRALIV